MPKNRKTFRNLIANKKLGPVFFVTPNPNRAVGIEEWIENYHIVCSQKADIINYIKKSGVGVFCLDDSKIKNSGKILANKKTISYIKEKSKDRIANIITFKPSPQVAKICNEYNFRYLGNDWKLNRKLEDKTEFVRITKELGIPNAKSAVVKLEEVKNLSFAKSKNGRCVVQLPRGFSGNSTFLVESREDLNQILTKYGNRKVKLSEYLKGETYTINACIAQGEVLVSKPIFQVTGFSFCNKNRFGTCGNDYSRGGRLRSTEKKEMFNCAKKVGNYIKRLGYKGIFGLDFIVTSRNIDNKTGKYLPNGTYSTRIHLVEINPRLVGSIPVFTKLQIKNKEVPFLLLHILEFLGDKSENVPQNGSAKLPSSACQQDTDFRKWDRKNNFNASQLILRNVDENPIRVTKPLESGIYKIASGRLILKEKAYYMKRNLEEDEFLIQCAGKDSVINPDIEYANVQVGYGIMKSANQFKSCFVETIDVVLKNIKTETI